MDVKPTNHFKDRRARLHPEMQVRVDDLVNDMIVVAYHMCELKTKYQDITIQLDGDLGLRFLLADQKSLYIMFLEYV